MSSSLVHLLIRFLVFGGVIGYACHVFKDVKVQPKPAIAVVAVVFAVMNAVLYTLLATVLNVVTLFALWFAIPFIVNGVLLLATDKIVKWFSIESITALVKVTGLLTVAHIVLHIANI
jgi:hypothetical protein